ncbi:MAG: DUF835 domain-containing protein [Candidatus Altiarchaeota archaeon]
MANAGDLARREKELSRRARQIELKEKEVIAKEKSIFALEKKLRMQADALRLAEKKIHSREKKLLGQEKKLEAKEAKLVVQEKKARSELARIFAREKKQGGKDSASLKKREARKRSELSRILSREQNLYEREDALLTEERRLEDADRKLRKKELEKITRLDGVVSAEKKLEELELHLEQDRDDVLKSIEEVRRLRSDFRAKDYTGRRSTGGWDDKLPSLKPGNIYLVDEHDVLVSGVIPSKSIELFNKAAGKSRPGLYVTRSNPKHVEGHVLRKKADFLWLTESSVASSKYKTVYTIEHLSIRLTNYLGANKSAVVLLDGLEYMISNMGFEVVLPFVQSMRDYVSTTEAIVVIPINSGAFDPHELSMLSRECYVLG